MPEIKAIKVPSGNKFPPLKDKTGIIPPHTFCIGLIAPKGAGKTTFICNLILEEDFYKGYFHTIQIFSPTINNDDKWETVRTTKGLVQDNVKLRKLLETTGPKKRDIGPIVWGGTEAQWYADLHRTRTGFDGKIPEECYHTTYSQDTLQGLINDQLEKSKQVQKKLEQSGRNKAESKYYLDRQLWIFDDQVGSTLFRISNNENAFNQLATSSRHLSCSWIVVSQGFKAIPPIVRANLFQTVIFHLSNQRELDKVYEEFPCALTRPEWDACYQYCIAEPYSFMFIDHRDNPPCMYKRFMEKL